MTSDMLNLLEHSKRKRRKIVSDIENGTCILASNVTVKLYRFCVKKCCVATKRGEIVK